MDGSFALGMTADQEPHDTTMVIGNDERRMHVRAYNYWSSLLRDREFPSIEDLEPGDVVATGTPEAVAAEAIDILTTAARAAPSGFCSPMRRAIIAIAPMLKPMASA